MIERFGRRNPKLYGMFHGCIFMLPFLIIAIGFIVMLMILAS